VSGQLQECRAGGREFHISLSSKEALVNGSLVMVVVAKSLDAENCSSSHIKFGQFMCLLAIVSLQGTVIIYDINSSSACEYVIVSITQARRYRGKHDDAGSNETQCAQTVTVAGESFIVGSTRILHRVLALGSVHTASLDSTH